MSIGGPPRSGVGRGAGARSGPGRAGAVRDADDAILAVLRRARDLMDREFAAPLDLGTIADRVGYSKYHFARAFAAAYGETPMAYLTRRRVERAKDLLRSANLTVTEICMLVGFSSLGSFSARFAALVGCSPSAYRAAMIARGGPPPIPGCMLLRWTRPDGRGTGGGGMAGGRRGRGPVD